MSSADRVGLGESGCMTGRVPRWGPGHHVPEYSNLVPSRSFRGSARGRGKGQRMGRSGHRMEKGRGTGRRRHRGKGIAPSSIAALTALPLPASSSDKDQQFEVLKAQARTGEQESNTSGEEFSQMHGYTKRNSRVATVNAARCTACGACAAVCPMDAITVNAVAHIETANCAGCGVCVDACPQEAITLKSQ